VSIGEIIPVPFPDLVECVVALHGEDAAHVAREAWMVAQLRLTHTPTTLSDPTICDAWHEQALGTLLAYGYLCCYRDQLRSARPNQWSTMAAHHMLRALQNLWANAVLPDVGKELPRRIPGVRLRWPAASWMGIEELHARHRTALVRMRPSWYRDVLRWRDQLRFTDEADLSLPPQDFRKQRDDTMLRAQTIDLRSRRCERRLAA